MKYKLIFNYSFCLYHKEEEEEEEEMSSFPISNENIALTKFRFKKTGNGDKRKLVANMKRTVKF